MINNTLLSAIQAEAGSWAEQAMDDSAGIPGGAVANTDSPIEAQLLVAFTFKLRLWGHSVLVVERGETIKPKFYEDGAARFEMLVIPQFKIHDYRVDFAVFHSADPAVKVVVECDGHDFHERTKGQAQRDKSRDRMLQQLGYKVIRFTGSEIYRKPLDSADDLWAVVQGWLHDNYLARHK